ncbi:hypothetical protein ACFE04_024938 [Oxalis oulophora]
MTETHQQGRKRLRCCSQVTEEQLLLNYLYNKLKKEPLPDTNTVFEFDLYGSLMPWEIWDMFSSNNTSNDSSSCLYFITPLTRISSKKYKRTVGPSPGGSWKGETSAVEIRDSRGIVIGYKKLLRFEDKHGSVHTNHWLLNEYTLHSSLSIRPNNSINSDDVDYVLCRLKKTEPRGPRKNKKKVCIRLDELQPQEEKKIDVSKQQVLVEHHDVSEIYDEQKQQEVAQEIDDPKLRELMLLLEEDVDVDGYKLDDELMLPLEQEADYDIDGYMLHDEIILLLEETPEQVTATTDHEQKQLQKPEEELQVEEAVPEITTSHDKLLPLEEEVEVIDGDHDGQGWDWIKLFADKLLKNNNIDQHFDDTTDDDNILLPNKLCEDLLLESLVDMRMII